MREALYFLIGWSEMQQTCHRVPLYISFSQVFDSANHLPQKWPKFGTVPKDMEHHSLCIATQSTCTRDLRKKVVQSGGNPIPRGQDLVTGLLYSSGHGRPLSKMEDFLLLRVTEMSCKV